MQVNILEAKNALSRLIRHLEAHEEGSITIARHGKPVAMLVPIEQPASTKRIGIARGKFSYTPEWDSPELNAEVAEQFEGAL